MLYDILTIYIYSNDSICIHCEELVILATYFSTYITQNHSLKNCWCSLTSSQNRSQHKTGIHNFIIQTWLSFFLLILRVGQQLAVVHLFKQLLCVWSSEKPLVVWDACSKTNLGIPASPALHDSNHRSVWFTNKPVKWKNEVLMDMESSTLAQNNAYHSNSGILWTHKYLWLSFCWEPSISLCRHTYHLNPADNELLKDNTVYQFSGQEFWTSRYS
jgi:hypothetical protein